MGNSPFGPMQSPLRLFNEPICDPPPTRAKPISDETVKTIYKAYPREAKPKVACKAIRAALRDLLNEGNEDPVAYLMEATREYAKAVKTWPESMKSGSTNYVPHPSSWFNGGCYEEDRNEWYKGERKRPAPAGKTLTKWEDMLKIAINAVTNSASDREMYNRQAELRTLIGRVTPRLKAEPSIANILQHAEELL